MIIIMIILVASDWRHVQLRKLKVMQMFIFSESIFHGFVEAEKQRSLATGNEDSSLSNDAKACSYHCHAERLKQQLACIKTPQRNEHLMNKLSPDEYAILYKDLFEPFNTYDLLLNLQENQQREAPPEPNEPSGILLKTNKNSTLNKTI